jgi:hypothetical protein
MAACEDCLVGGSYRRGKVESVDEAQGKIVPGENLRLLKNHNGYWLPVYISEDGRSTTTIEINIKSKVFQATFMLNAIRDKAAIYCPAKFGGLS